MAGSRRSGSFSPSSRSRSFSRGRSSKSAKKEGLVEERKPRYQSSRSPPRNQSSNKSENFYYKPNTGNYNNDNADYQHKEYPPRESGYQGRPHYNSYQPRGGYHGNEYRPRHFNNNNYQNNRRPYNDDNTGYTPRPSGQSYPPRTDGYTPRYPRPQGQDNDYQTGGYQKRFTPYEQNRTYSKRPYDNYDPRPVYEANYKQPRFDNNNANNNNNNNNNNGVEKRFDGEEKYSSGGGGDNNNNNEFRRGGSRERNYSPAVRPSRPYEPRNVYNRQPPRQFNNNNYNNNAQQPRYYYDKQQQQHNSGGFNKYGHQNEQRGDLDQKKLLGKDLEDRPDSNVEPSFFDSEGKYNFNLSFRHRVCNVFELAKGYCPRKVCPFWPCYKVKSPDMFQCRTVQNGHKCDRKFCGFTPCCFEDRREWPDNREGLKPPKHMRENDQHNNTATHSETLHAHSE